MAKMPKAIKLKNAKKHIKKERGISFAEITLLPPDYNIKLIGSEAVRYSDFV